MKIAFWDLESSPNETYTFQTYKAFIAPAQIITPQRVISYALKYRGSRTMYYGDERTGHKEMVKELHKLLSEADAFCTYNGKSFDLKMFNAECVKYGLKPLPPTAHIDLYKVVKKQFRLPSNKLEYVAQFLGIGEKVKHHGFHLWKECLAGDEKAWAVMAKYNKQDTLLLEALYEKLLPWIGSSHPSRSLEEEAPCCTVCGSDRMHRKGHQRSKIASYPRFQCQSCGSWSRGRKTEVSKDADVLVSL